MFAFVFFVIFFVRKTNTAMTGVYWLFPWKKCRWKTLGNRIFRGRFRGVFQILCVTFRCAFRFGIENFSGQFRSAEVPPQQKPTPNPEIPKKNTAFIRTFSKSSRECFCRLLCDMSQEPNRNCSEKLVQIIFLGGGIFRVEFPPAKKDIRLDIIYCCNKKCLHALIYSVEI